MSDLLYLAAFFVVPLAAVCGGLYGWGRLTLRPALGRWLRISATAWFCVLFFGTALLVATDATCSGNVLYGYRDCTAYPDWLASVSVGLFLLGYPSGIAYGVILVLAGCAVEWWHRQT